MSYALIKLAKKIATQSALVYVLSVLFCLPFALFWPNYSAIEHSFTREIICFLLVIFVLVMLDRIKNKKHVKLPLNNFGYYALILSLQGYACFATGLLFGFDVSESIFVLLIVSFVSFMYAILGIVVNKDKSFAIAATLLIFPLLILYFK